MKTKSSFLIGIAVVVVLVCEAKAVVVLPVNMADLMNAEVIFTGTCVGVDAHLTQTPNGRGEVLVTTYTFLVPRDGVLKGEVPETFKFTQYGASREDERRLGRQITMNPLPQYEVGKEYMLFLTAESKLGLRSPIGMGQGKFSIITTSDGKKQAVNDKGNEGLFGGLPETKGVKKALSVGGITPQALPAKGPVDYDAFVRMVRELKKGE